MVSCDYDSENDVLYLSIGEPQPAHGEDIGKTSGIIIQRSPTAGEVVGLTIVGFKQSIKEGLLEKYKEKLSAMLPKVLLEGLYRQLRKEGK